MATQAKEANPYNANKDWHKQDEKQFVSADGAFFEEPKPKVEAQEKEEPKQTKKETKDKPYSKPDYKKRYDDLKTHYDSKLGEFKAREKELLEEAAKNRPNYVAPKSEEELAKFREQYPDVYEVVETVAHLQSSEKTKTLEERVAALQEREAELISKQAQERLINNHPDFEEIKNSDEFHSWAKSQPQSIQDWIYKNASDGDLASRALDLYKRDIGLDSKASKPKKKKSNKSAADMVSTKTTAVEPNTQDKIWTEQEIAAMSIAEFDKYEEEIGKAIHEGRVVKQ
tara:strand:+ start:125 stop:979 length:855 start_codon:yes stop_codon:yes gene_type:complete